MIVTAVWTAMAVITFVDVGNNEKWPLSLQVAATVFWPYYVIYQVYKLIK